MPKRFSREFNSLHDEFFAILDDDSKRRCALAAPRGFGKTSIDTIAFPARKLLFQENSFVVIVSATHEVAAQNVRNLGMELTENADIIRTFGDLKGPIWSYGKGRLQLSNGATVLARGAGQQIRGLLERAQRPDLIIVDDLEDPEAYRVSTWEDYIRKTMEWFFADLLGAIDVKVTRVVVVGTILHELSLLQRLLDDKDWDTVRLELCDDNYRSNFPDYMSDEEIQDLVRRFANNGMMDVFAREYRNLPIATEDAIFKSEYFHYYKTSGVDDDGRPIKDPAKDLSIDRVVIVDPAKTVKTQSAYTAIVGAGFSNKKNHLYFLRCINERLKPDEIYELAYRMAVELRTTLIAIEVTSLNLFITQPFNMYLASKGYPPVIELHAHGNKADRIKQLAPLYRMGHVYHNPDPVVHGPLEAQLMSFDRSKFWDVMDCFAYTIEVLSIGKRMFTINESEDVQALEDEIAMLDALEEHEEPLELNWRQAP